MRQRPLNSMIFNEAMRQVKAGEEVTLIVDYMIITPLGTQEVDVEERMVLTNKDRLCERSEPQSYPIVGRARE